MDTQSCSQYLDRMTDQITQMAFVLSHWKETNNNLNWMEVHQCQGTCQGSALQQFSNFKVTTSHVTPVHTDPASGYPTLEIMENGVQKTLFVQYPEWTPTDDVIITGDQIDFEATAQSTVRYEFAKRLYLSESSTLDNTQFYRPNLLGGILEYDVDLSDVSCGCVAQFAGVMMPTDANWRDPFHYCDANQNKDARGHICPEFDFMQANKHAIISKAHKCDAPQNGIYNQCDLSGSCKLNPKHLYFHGFTGAYGAGSNYKINSELPFRVKMEFFEQNGQFQGYRRTLT